VLAVFIECSCSDTATHPVPRLAWWYCRITALSCTPNSIIRYAPRQSPKSHSAETDFTTIFFKRFFNSPGTLYQLQVSQYLGYYALPKYRGYLCWQPEMLILPAIVVFPTRVLINTGLFLVRWPNWITFVQFPLARPTTDWSIAGSDLSHPSKVGVLCVLTDQWLKLASPDSLGAYFERSISKFNTLLLRLSAFANCLKVFSADIVMSS